MNSDNLQKLTRTFLNRHWPNVQDNYKHLTEVGGVAAIGARDALMSSLVSEVLSNPPATFHSSTGGEFANMGKANTNQHKEVKALLTAAVNQEIGP